MTSLVEVVVIATIAGCATGLGALPTLVTDRVSHRVYDGALGLAGGIMVGAAVFALVLPGLELGTPLEVVAGVLLGGAFLLVTNAVLPHLHLWFRDDRLEGTTVLEPVGGNSGSDPSPTTVRRGETDDTDGRADSEDDLRRAALVGSAVTIHNVPEGLAVGIAFASGETALGLAIATAIAVQNVPDGFAIAVPRLERASRGRRRCSTRRSRGRPEPIAAAAGFALVAVVTGLFPIAAGFAAGAMIAVVFRELVPRVTATATPTRPRRRSSSASRSC